MIGLPPFGAVQDTVAASRPATAETPLGESGVVAGVTGRVTGEAEPVPTALVAATVKV